MDDGERVTLTAKQLKDLVVLLVLVVLVAVLAGLVLRNDDPASPYTAYVDAVATASAHPEDGEAAERAAEAERGLKILMGAGGMDVSTRDFNALNKSPGEAVVLLVGETELRVTPTRVATGTAACAPGPVTTVDLLVERVSGPAGLVPATFTVVAADGSATTPVQGCSTGFAEASEKRILVFAVAEPDRLIVGSDPGKPVVVWHLG